MEQKEDCCILPEKPKEPLQDDCCGSGCSYCVFDVYEMELIKWRNECKRLLSGGKQSIENETISKLDYKTFKLIGIYPSARHLNVYRFAIPNCLRLDIKPGQHLMMKGFNLEDEDLTLKMTAKEYSTNLSQHSIRVKELSCSDELNNTPEAKLKYVTRPYTVLNIEDDHFDILIKLYENGQMSKYIKRLKVNDDVLWRGPFGDFCHNPSHSGSGARTMLVLCAGTGIAPVYAISKSVVSDEDDETRIRILWANRSWEDLPLKKEMQELTSYWNFSCKLFFSEGLNSVPYGAKTFYEINDGKVNYEALKVEMDSLVDTEIQVLLCGTTSFEEDMMEYLNKFGFKSSSYRRFT